MRAPARSGGGGRKKSRRGRGERRAWARAPPAPEEQAAAADGDSPRRSDTPAVPAWDHDPGGRRRRRRRRGRDRAARGKKKTKLIDHPLAEDDRFGSVTGGVGSQESKVKKFCKSLGRKQETTLAISSTVQNRYPNLTDLF